MTAIAGLAVCALVQVASPAGASDEPIWVHDGAVDDPVLGKVKDVLVLADGGLLVLDAQQKMVFRFDALGDFEGVFARPGEAPGELQDPRSLVEWRGRAAIVQGRPPAIVLPAWNGSEPETVPLTDPQSELVPYVDDARSGGGALYVAARWEAMSEKGIDVRVGLCPVSDDAELMAPVRERQEFQGMSGMTIREIGRLGASGFSVGRSGLIR